MPAFHLGIFLTDWLAAATLDDDDEAGAGGTPIWAGLKENRRPDGLVETATGDETPGARSIWTKGFLRLSKTYGSAE